MTFYQHCFALESVVQLDTDVSKGSRNWNSNRHMQKESRSGLRQLRLPKLSMTCCTSQTSTFPFDLRLFLITQHNPSTLFLDTTMSKRPPNNNNAANAPVAKKSRIDIDDTVTELHVMTSHLLDALKAQKAAIQWGHTTCRDDTLASITKTELLISSIGELRKKAKE